jgi:hypothetical protein
MRDELLNESLLFGLDHARQVIGSWADDYNSVRPDSSLRPLLSPRRKAYQPPRL